MSTTRQPQPPTVPIPRFAEGPNGNPVLDRLFMRAAVIFFAGDMAFLVFTGVLHSSKPQVAGVFYAVCIALTVIALLAYAGHQFNKPLPTREELIAKLEAEIAELQEMLDRIGESGTRRSVQAQLIVKCEQIRQIGGVVAHALTARPAVPVRLALTGGPKPATPRKESSQRNVAVR